MVFLQNLWANLAEMEPVPVIEPIVTSKSVEIIATDSIESTFLDSFQADMQIEEPFQQVTSKRKIKASAQKFTYGTKSKAGSPNLSK